MCCTFTKSEMSKTRLYVGEAEKDGKTVHVLAYQNKAGSKGPNAMVIPFPTDVGMSKDNVIDTSKFKNFLEDISNATREYMKGGDRRSMTLGAAAFNRAEVFDVGSYTVVLADNVKQIPEALTRVSEAKRPVVSTQFLMGYGKLYPDQPIAVCCWNGAIDAEPLMWWYEPFDRTQLFIPTMDAHDGLAPRVGEPVSTDHIISVGSVGPTAGRSVRYTQTIPSAVKDLLPTHVHGHRLPRIMDNGDAFVKTATLHADKSDLILGKVDVDLFHGFGNKITYQSRMDGWH